MKTLSDVDNKKGLGERLWQLPYETSTFRQRATLNGLYWPVKYKRLEARFLSSSDPVQKKTKKIAQVEQIVPEVGGSRTIAESWYRACLNASQF